MSEEEILDVIEEGILNGWDIDCTNRSIALCVLDAIKSEGLQIVKTDEAEPAK